MIVSKTPLRISFVGGGTDIPYFYKKNNFGSVINTTIDKYIYVFLTKRNNFFEKYRLNYSQTERVDTLEKIKNPIIKECIRYSGIQDRLYIGSTADFPSNTGLGSSSSFCVGLLNALFEFMNKKVSKFELAEIAADIEINKLKNPIGKQDHYAATFGGMNKFIFFKNGSVKRKKFHKSIAKKILYNSFLLWTGDFRSATEILEIQKKNIKSNNKYLIQIRNQTKIFEKKILSGASTTEINKIIDLNWSIKKNLHQKISNKNIDKLHNIIASIGGEGIKLLGAGNGGFLYFSTKKNKKKLLENPFLNQKIYNIGYEEKGSCSTKIF